MRLSLCALARRRLFAIGSLKATELGGSMVRVRGSAAKIMLPRYAPKKPNMGRSFTCGQPAISSTRAADQAFISSEILWSLGRARFMHGANYECQNPAHRASIERIFQFVRRAYQDLESDFFLPGFQTADDSDR